MSYNEEYISRENLYFMVPSPETKCSPRELNIQAGEDDLEMLFKMIIKKEEGRQHLRKLLTWNEFDDYIHLRLSIFLDLIYNSIIFAADKGFPWFTVAKVARLSEQLLNEFKGVSVLEALQLIEDKVCEFKMYLPSSHFTVLLDYFLTTFIRHYNLYQYVLFQEQERNQTFVDITIHVPPIPPPLTEGINIDLWRYEQQLANLTVAETQKRTNIFLLQQSLHEEKEEKLRALYENLDIGETKIINKQVLEKIVKEVIQVQVAGIGEIVCKEIKTNTDILELRLQKNALKPPTTYPPPLPSSKHSVVTTEKESQKKQSPIKKKK
ncbi:uncharacterized protein C8orf74 homolog [Discoglossus pictus]